MPNTHETLSSLFTDIANAIRTKKGESSEVKYVADNFPSAIAGIPTGGGSSLSSMSRIAHAYKNALTYIQGYDTTSVTLLVSPDASAVYYLTVVEVEYTDDNSNAGYAFILVNSSNYSTIDSGYSGQCDTIAISAPSGIVHRIGVDAIVTKDSNDRGMRAFMTVYSIS